MGPTRLCHFSPQPVLGAGHMQWCFVVPGSRVPGYLYLVSDTWQQFRWRGAGLISHTIPTRLRVGALALLQSVSLLCRFL